MSGCFSAVRTRTWSSERSAPPGRADRGPPARGLQADHAELHRQPDGGRRERLADLAGDPVQRTVDGHRRVGHRVELVEVDPDGVGPDRGEIGRHPAQHAGLAEPPGPEEGGEPVVHQPLGQVGDQLVPPGHLRRSERTLVGERAAVGHSVDGTRSDRVSNPRFNRVSEIRGQVGLVAQPVGVPLPSPTAQWLTSTSPATTTQNHSHPLLPRGRAPRTSASRTAGRSGRGAGGSTCRRRHRRARVAGSRT